jgi:hypothetical protein
MARNRESIRTREAIVLSVECVERSCGDCQDPDCSCPCHKTENEETIEDESP